MSHSVLVSESLIKVLINSKKLKQVQLDNMDITVIVLSAF